MRSLALGTAVAVLSALPALPAARACVACLRAGQSLHGANLPSAPAGAIQTGQLLHPTPGALVSPLAVPALSSRPQARAKLYLDFDGDFTPSWGFYLPGLTPAYGIDADATTFSPVELDNIRQIWAGVAEKFSPFDLDVTTINPGPLVKRESFRLVIGGNASWYAPAGGVAYVGSFYNQFDPSTAFVFSELLRPTDPLHTTFVVAASAHEAGHGFGLQHQSVWQGNVKIDEYNRGDAVKAPLMGSSYRKRGLWWQGTSGLSPGDIQDDLSVLSNTDNGFGYRPDDHADTAAGATPLAFTALDTLSGSGVLERITDVDYFTFQTLAGSVSLTLSAAAFEPMLDASLALYMEGGQLLELVATPSLGETLTRALDAGTYRVAVLSNGLYGDIGQYSLSAVLTAPVPEPTIAGVLAIALLGARRRI